MTAANIGEALLAKRKERRLDQGRASAEIGVSPSTYRSYERNTQRPSVNVFPSLAKFLGLEIEEFLPLYAATVIFALRPALERELAGLGMSSTSNGDTPAFEESDANGEWAHDHDSPRGGDDEGKVDDQDVAGDEHDEEVGVEEGTTTIDQRALEGDVEEVTIDEPQDEVAQVVIEAPSQNSDDDGDDDDDDDEDEDDEDDDEEVDGIEPLTDDDWLVDEPIESAPSLLSAPSTYFDKPVKTKKKKKKKKR